MITGRSYPSIPNQLALGVFFVGSLMVAIAKTVRDIHEVL